MVVRCYVRVLVVPVLLLLLRYRVAVGLRLCLCLVVLVFLACDVVVPVVFWFIVVLVYCGWRVSFLF